MHHGEWNGENAKQHGILILGESHHINKSTDPDAGIPASYTTEANMRDYLQHPMGKSYRFFDKIVASFGLDPNGQRNEFWNKVYFGNYIDVLCGVRDRSARNTLNAGNRETYNDQLFRFVNGHAIRTVFCFSVLAYNHLPSMADGESDTCNFLGMCGNRQVYLRHCLYKAGTPHDHTTVLLKHDLEVYGIQHPSAPGGYRPEIYAAVLAEKFR